MSLEFIKLIHSIAYTDRYFWTRFKYTETDAKSNKNSEFRLRKHAQKTSIIMR